MDETQERSAPAGSVFAVAGWFLDHPRVGTLVWSAGCALAVAAAPTLAAMVLGSVLRIALLAIAFGFVAAALLGSATMACLHLGSAFARAARWGPALRWSLIAAITAATVVAAWLRIGVWYASWEYR